MIDEKGKRAAFANQSRQSPILAKEEFSVKFVNENGDVIAARVGIQRWFTLNLEISKYI